jgi:Fe2+ transport system protein B
MTKFLRLFLLLNISLFADESIDAQINKIKSAPPAERVKLMNALKQRLSQMNREERSHAIKKLQNNMRSKEQDMQDRSQMMQMQHSEHMSNYQNMNQHQAGNQVSHEDMGSGTMQKRWKMK